MVWKKTQTNPNSTKPHIQGQEWNIFSCMGGTILWPCTFQEHCLFLALMLVIGLTSGERPQVDMHQEVCKARGSAGINSDLALTSGVTMWHEKSCSHQLVGIKTLFCKLQLLPRSCLQNNSGLHTDFSDIEEAKGERRKPNKPPEQKQSSSLQHLEELIVTADLNYCDNNTATEFFKNKLRWSSAIDHYY